MYAPWKKKTTIDKVEERLLDWLDQVKLDERVGDLREQIASSDRLDILRDQLPGVRPAKKSNTRRNVVVLAVVGAGAFVVVRRKTAGNNAKPSTFPAPAGSHNLS